MTSPAQKPAPATGPSNGRAAPLYASIADALRAEIITHHKPGDRLEAATKLAKRLGVSVLTVREAFNALTQEGLIERIRGSGTYVRQPPKGTIAILIGLGHEDLRHLYFFLELVHRLEMLLQAASLACRPYFAYLGRDATGAPIPNPTFARDVEEGQIAAVVPVSVMIPEPLLTALAGRRIPVIGDHATRTDYATMVREATSYLLAHGRRRLALLQPPDSETTSLFGDILAKSGIEPVPDWHCGGLALEDGDALHADFVRMLQARSEMPDGLVCLNDVVFERFIPTLLELGIEVPAQLMIVTHANKGSGIRIPFPVARMEVDPDAYADAVAAEVYAWAADTAPPDAPAVIRHRWIPEQVI